MAVRIINGQRPSRPKEDPKWLSNEIWDLLVACWELRPILRPPLECVHEEFKILVARSNGSAARGGGWRFFVFVFLICVLCLQNLPQSRLALNHNLKLMRRSMGYGVESKVHCTTRTKKEPLYGLRRERYQDAVTTHGIRRDRGNDKKGDTTAIGRLNQLVLLVLVGRPD